MPRYLETLPLLVQGMGGLGDGIYQRPVIHAQASRGRVVYLTTPWPELYADLPGVRAVRPFAMRLRTQQKHLDRLPASTWARVPVPHERRVMTYQLRKPGVTILTELEDRMGVEALPFAFDLPDLGPCPVEVPEGRPLAVVRPSTLRKEWCNRARAPRPEYLYEAGRQLRARGYYVVTIADVHQPDEWLDGERPPADLELLHGELTPIQAVALVQHAALVVGGLGWIVPAALAARAPMVVVAGGQGGHNAPEKIMDPRMDSARARWLLPDHYCRCTAREHACAKTIPDFSARFRGALEELNAA